MALTKSGTSSSVHEPLRQSTFRGLYARGTGDIAPDGFFNDCLNTKYTSGAVATRDGSGLFFDTSGHKVVRFYRYRRLSETPRFIYLDDAGNLRDSLFSPAIWTDSDITDFSLVNYNNRAYITPHNRKTGIASKSVLVYDGSGVARLAGGSAPTGFTLGLANSGASGNVELGFHFFAVAFITNTGFITAPGPAVYSSISAPGSKKVDLSSIALGGSSVVARVILATKAIPASLFSSNQLNYELFFVPSANGGLIADNTTTTATVNFYDSELLDSADYLIDNLSTIPAGVGIGVYNGRLIVWGEAGNPFTVRVSAKLQPENFSSVSGFINVNPANSGDGIRNCFEQRKSLIIATPTKFFATSDNGDDPNTWTSPETVEDSLGTECFGVATISDTKASSSNRILIATHAGLVSFEGYIKKPELSYNIEDIWFRINKAHFDTVQVVDDPTNHLVYILAPLDAATVPNVVLVGDYTESFTYYGTIDPNNIKWSIWKFFGGVNISSIAGDLDDTDKSPILFLSRDVGNIYDTGKANGLKDDNGATIESFIETNLKTPQRGWISHFAGIKLRIVGSGMLQVSLSGEDDSNSQTPPSLVLSANPGGELDRPFNFQNEKCSVKLRVNTPGDYFNLSELTLFSKPLWLRRPA